MSIAIEVDYARHPAFQAFPASPSRPALAEYFARLDALWEKLVGASGSSSDVAAQFQKEYARLIEEIAPLLREHADDAYRPFVLQAFERSSKAILDEILCEQAARAAKRRHGSKAETIAQALRTTSATAFPMDPDLRTRIAKSLAPVMDQLRAERGKGDGRRCFAAVPSWGEHWQLVRRFVRENGVEEGISAYSGYPLELSGYALTYSHPDETWFKICYADLGLAAPQTVQMHFDEENTSAKSMLYLNEIGEDNGAFSYVPRSAARVSSRSRLSFMKYLDFAHADFAASRGVGGGTYNRAVFHSPSLRPYFAKLPRELQGSSGMGDDILDGSPLSQALLANEHKITSKQGDLALFAGGETLHRGGIASKGERWALQMLYKPPLSYDKKIKQSATSFLIRTRNRIRELVN